MKEDTLVARGKDAVWTPDSTKNKIGKVIRVKFACGSSAAGFLYPIVIQVSNLSTDEMPTDDFVVVPIPGLTVSGNIDPRSNELGYLCLTCASK